ncbi:hypothetical protein SGUI_1146 [Serinicoccus hydrothermalis]|uniref:Uncharacterized protein n=1 Tax=Serinicoccus hydrothermalis TaxID=1758689 RepID=A0A1B1NAT5_9MICO|nr:hypothetical protein SGUI_1146 [Serinicoccus hydrothermalis]
MRPVCAKCAAGRRKPCGRSRQTVRPVGEGPEGHASGPPPP